MRPVLLLALSLTAAAVAAAGTPPVLTIVLEFQGPYSPRSVDEMRREFQTVMADTGLQFRWKMRSEVGQESYDNLVVVRFKGKCILRPVGYLYDERGPLAFTYADGSTVLPFSEVACDRVTASVRSAMFGGDYNHSDLLLGRALGRVVAHELVHILTDSGAHGKTGVEKTALSGSLLIAPTLKLSAADLERLKLAR
jgi:hypothetical protein